MVRKLASPEYSQSIRLLDTTHISFFLRLLCRGVLFSARACRSAEKTIEAPPSAAVLSPDDRPCRSAICAHRIPLLIQISREGSRLPFGDLSESLAAIGTSSSGIALGAIRSIVPPVPARPRVSVRAAD